MTWELVKNHLKHLACYLWNGHAMLMTFTPGRFRLRCAQCGYETEGWEISKKYSMSYKDYCVAYQELVETDTEMRTGG